MHLPPETLDELAKYAAPLAPSDRDRFINAAVQRLTALGAAGAGPVNRVVRDLITSGDYVRAAVGGPAPGRRRPRSNYDAG
jgi:hypothetical protein